MALTRKQMGLPAQRNTTKYRDALPKLSTDLTAESEDALLGFKIKGLKKHYKSDYSPLEMERWLIGEDGTRTWQGYDATRIKSIPITPVKKVIKKLGYGPEVYIKNADDENLSDVKAKETQQTDCKWLNKTGPEQLTVLASFRDGSLAGADISIEFNYRAEYYGPLTLSATKLAEEECNQRRLRWERMRQGWAVLQILVAMIKFENRSAARRGRPYKRKQKVTPDVIAA